MEKKKYSKISISDLLILTEGLTFFGSFNTGLKSLMTKHNRESVINNLNKIYRGEFVFLRNDLHKFYEQHKEIIDIITKYSSLGLFISSHYDCEGKLSSISPLHAYYLYLLDNTDNKLDILALLTKLKSLGVTTLELDPNADFRKEKYKVYSSFSLNQAIEYVANAEVIPSCNFDVITYTTSDSDYKITLKTLSKDVSPYGRKIIVRSIMFNPNTLPSKLTKEEAFDELVAKKRAKKEAFKKVSDAVYLSVSVDDLEKQIAATSASFENHGDPCEARVTLKKMGQLLSQLRIVNARYKEEALASDSTITEELLNTEKEMYLRRLNSLNIL